MSFGVLGVFIVFCVLYVLSDDRTVNSSSAFIAEALGPQYVEPLTVTLEPVWTDANAATPIILLLSPGAGVLSFPLYLFM